MSREYIFSNRISSLAPSAIREILKHTANPEVIPFAAGNPAPEAFPVKEIREITSDILDNAAITALQYSISEGYLPLRQNLKALTKAAYNIGNENNELIIVSGAQQGIELSCKVLCNEGESIICESPSFIGSLNAFRSYKANLCPVEMEDDGMNIELLKQTLKTNKNVKFIYTIPNFQNPSGITMSLEKRKALYNLAVKYNVFIVEDNPYGDLRFSGEELPSLKSMDTEGIVIYCGSFSKTLSPGLRVGFVVAAKEIISKIVVAKQVSDVHTTILSQMIVDKFITEYNYKEHIKSLKQIYAAKSKLMLSEMDKALSNYISYTRPEGGLFIWCRLPDRIDMMTFCRQAIEKKVAVVPGTAFLTDEAAKTQCFRINYSTPTDKQIIDGIKILEQLFKEINP